MQKEFMIFSGQTLYFHSVNYAPKLHTQGKTLQIALNQEQGKLGPICSK